MSKTRFKKRAKTCGICMCEVEFQGELDCCKHVFCLDCIKEWAKIENTCPICKIRFTTIKRIPHRVYYADDRRMEEILLVDHRAQNIDLDSENFHIYIGNAQRLIENEFQRLITILYHIFRNHYDMDLTSLSLEI